MLEQQENKRNILVNELEIGENSNMISDFDNNTHLLNLHAKYL